MVPCASARVEDSSDNEGAAAAPAAPPHPADLLGELWSALSVGQVPRAEVRAWFCFGVAGAVRRDAPLDTALGFALRGQPSLQRYLLTLARNEYLLEALCAVAVDEAVPDWTRCVRLSRQVASFMGTTWPRVRLISEPPADWPAWKRAVFNAARTGMPVPGTPRALWDVLKSNPPFSFQQRPAKVLAQLLERKHA